MHPFRGSIIFSITATIYILMVIRISKKMRLVLLRFILESNNHIIILDGQQWFFKVSVR
jgi:hypothetical protein